VRQRLERRHSARRESEAATTAHKKAAKTHSIVTNGRGQLPQLLLRQWDTVMDDQVFMEPLQACSRGGVPPHIQSVDPTSGNANANASMPRGVKRGRDAGACVCGCVVIMDGCGGSVSTAAAWCVMQLEATATMLVWLL
jgi:hypothetical protein